MKKILFTIILLFTLINVSHADDYKWSRVVSSLDGTSEFYIDKSSVRKVGKYHYYWMMVDYLKLEKGDDPNVRSNISFNILNCRTNEFKMVTHTSFSLNKTKGEVNMDEIIPDFDINYFDWRYYDDSTSFGMVFNKVCKLER